ncbi:hypothetical protein [Celeribacter sp. ULVN23_4]
MKSLVTAMFAFAFLASCGVDGEPVKPEVSGKTTVGVSNHGGFTDTEINIHFPAN